MFRRLIPLLLFLLITPFTLTAQDAHPPQFLYRVNGVSSCPRTRIDARFRVTCFGDLSIRNCIIFALPPHMLRILPCVLTLPAHEMFSARGLPKPMYRPVLDHASRRTIATTSTASRPPFTLSSRCHSGYETHPFRDRSIVPCGCFCTRDSDRIPGHHCCKTGTNATTVSTRRLRH